MNVKKNLRELKLPSEEEIFKIFSKSYNILNNLPNVAEIEPPITIVGNINGQFKNLLNIFKIGADIPDANYLFLGDYVHRGSYGVETFLYLLILKIKYPDRITLLRGSNDMSGIVKINGFLDECEKKFKRIKTPIRRRNF